ncbi:hypothetical protein PLICRDRAFT_125405 [Plicaturopsis crispa FD-325 SS-3]|nr:hypothetical protein PLICRDRAFT_125405 [Plicaturopsis crispa FD-325 SS-3]
MTAIGSVFLGDFARHRILSSSTPPSSPPPLTSPSAMSTVFPASSFSPPQSAPPDITQTPQVQPTPVPAPPPPPPVIDPALSLELRLRWLEALLLGVRQDAKDRKGKERERAPVLKNGESLLRLAEDVQRRLDNVVDSNEGLKRFMEHYDQHAHLLTPSFALSGSIPTTPPSYENMAPGELEAFLAEMEPDIRAADRDMREIELLEKKGVTGGGKLADFEPLKPRLEALIKAHEEDDKLAASLERRIAHLMERHATQVDALSELFVAWDDTITVAEDKVSRLERDKAERKRLGYE